MIDACTCCCGNVLIWGTNTGVGASYGNLTTVLEALGLTVHTNVSWSGTLSDYGLIIWGGASSDPTWWSEITGNTWNGRLVITAENNGFPATITYVNGLSAMTGVTIISDGIDAVCDHDGTVEVDDLTAGQTVIKYAYTSEVSGGTILSKTVTGAKPWLTRNKPSGSLIDFVVAGDVNWLDNSCGASVITANTPLWQNLWNVAI